MPFVKTGWHFYLFLFMGFINANGRIVKASKTLLGSADHSYRYGDGLFETMKLKEDQILLKNLHFERLFNSLAVLAFNIPSNFTPDKLEKEIIDLCRRNHCTRLARIRLSVSRGSGGLHDCNDQLHYIIECSGLALRGTELDQKGYEIAIFPEARKSCDVFSNLKSSSHLQYVMAAGFAKENKLNDCLLLNTHSRICDSSFANIFWIRKQTIFTPPLSEGCIAGITRRYLMELNGLPYRVKERKCTIADLENADEIFLTNAIQGIKWVQKFKKKIYSNTITRQIYAAYRQSLE